MKKPVLLSIEIEEKILDLDINLQPDDVTCGPTCLHSIYKYFGEKITLKKVIGEVSQLSTGGTLAVCLGNHALQRGYNATIYTYNLHVFDPSWFRKGVDLSEKLSLQMKAKSKNKTLAAATKAYLTFLSYGGQIKYEELTATLIKSYLLKNIPVLTGLSATYLYNSPREIGEFRVSYDDINGEPAGHFVIVNGYNSKTKKVSIADPLLTSFSENHYYRVDFKKLIASIMLGVVTYDANLIMIHPKK